MSRQQAFGGCFTAAVMLLFASFAFFGWSMPGRSMTSFQPTDLYPKLSKDQEDIVLTIVEDYRNTGPGHTCIEPLTTERGWAIRLLDSSFEPRGFGNEYKHLPPPEKPSAEAVEGYQRSGLRWLNNKEALTARGFMVPHFWQTSKCAQWISITTPVFLDDTAFVVLHRTRSEVKLPPCFFATRKYRRVAGSDERAPHGWRPFGGRTTLCHPVI